eukprot:5898493-Prymnesium_polylepis.1
MQNRASTPTHDMHLACTRRGAHQVLTVPYGYDSKFRHRTRASPAQLTFWARRADRCCTAALWPPAARLGM